ncbi:MAG: ribonuclease M5 [Veillonellaceae bacterium]|nr:ribonuclease M5 [Veillonellaceae bacterium]
MLQEVIVVEGKSDIARVRLAVDADLIATEGFVLSERTLEAIRYAYEKRGIIILTDPDGAGERIRRFLTERFPQAAHAFVPREEATAHDDIGIEQASPEAIRAALAKVRTRQFTPQNEFTAADLWRAGLTGMPTSAARRARLGKILGIGYGNAKRFLERLNHYGVTREEWREACKEAEAEDGN